MSLINIGYLNNSPDFYRKALEYQSLAEKAFSAGDINAIVFYTSQQNTFTIRSGLKLLIGKIDYLILTVSCIAK
ncbi:hypothetical protein WA1_47985 [Scytonema hofmannii PCC 7110]|uniref:Uncharacterized protein n=1 Tax=Scytonema hofmannii PCC 7110 TaxID=128403 RepID=A0A139WY72_9CYAN|nr:hypothetical protein [Scytonema hofmannii]KYC37353.1 hypothetical protein WA1_47985 [Scytonema hofmannii PCC 7110]